MSTHDHEADRERLWREALTQRTSLIRRVGVVGKRLPGDPRCKVCRFPLSGPLTPLLALAGRGPSRGNPRFCNSCERYLQKHPGGAEIGLSLLFADVRGSTGIAERIGSAAFASLLRRFYDAANTVLAESDAFVDRPIGDEVIGVYLPVWAPDHPAHALAAARRLLEVTGHGEPDGPWIPVGCGVHSGEAYVGTVDRAGTDQIDMTVLGDVVNVAARLASAAGTGEILVSADTGLDLDRYQRRSMQLKGRATPLDVYLMSVDESTG